MAKSKIVKVPEPDINSIQATDGQAYEYWIPVVSHTHYLYAEEIARALGIKTVGNKVAKTFVELWCNNYLEKAEKPPTFYHTAAGKLIQCFHPQVIPAIREAFAATHGKLSIEARDGRTYHAIMQEYYESN